MDNAPSNQTNNQPAPQPAQPEVLKPRVGFEPPAVKDGDGAKQPTTGGTKPPPRRHTYRPSHRATFIGLAVVILILSINAAVLGFVLKKQSKQEDLFEKGQVSISTDDLNRLGINRSVIGDSGVELTVAPDAVLKGKLSVAGSSVFSGQVSFSDKVSGTNANFADLQAGNTALSELNVNGKSSLSDLSLRKDFTVAGSTRLQGPVTVTQLLSVTNNLNVSGNLAVGGTLSVNTLSVQAIAIKGHLVTSGSTPSVVRGSATGSNGTVSISGNDAAGTIGINIGAGASGGTLATVAFRAQYGNTPKVVISPVGIGGSFYVSNISIGGFSVGVNSGLPPGGYKINYIAVQ
jgi:hypothetical protein